ncbi:MAG: flagellar biosynthetic protein FliR [Candidatus Margulisbacteria bacterium]|nr:flagellar biosynthetic protein FliR [Candidatus Margulisiibacteriota bacterium]
MTYPIINIPQLLIYFLFLMRVMGIFVSAPIFGTRTIPIQAKVGMAVILAYIFYMLFLPYPAEMMKNISPLTYMMLIFTEVVLGLMIGYIALLIFAVVQFSGSMIDIMTGMHIASVIDPMTREQQSLIGQLQYIIAILLFLVFNGHHYILTALFYSFKLIPLGTLTFGSTVLPQTFIKILSYSFVVGLQLAFPIIAILFLIDFSLGIISKGIPQMNVFLTSMPLKSFAGFAALFIAFIYFGNYFSKIPQITLENIVFFLRAF